MLIINKNQVSFWWRHGACSCIQVDVLEVCVVLRGGGREQAVRDREREREKKSYLKLYIVNKEFFFFIVKVFLF